MKLLRCYQFWATVISLIELSPIHAFSPSPCECRPVRSSLWLENKHPGGDDAHLLISRSRFLKAAGGTALTIGAFSGSIIPVEAFEGGVGGLGKTKPETGVALWDSEAVPIQNPAGVVSAEIKSLSSKPILVQFQTPWPILPTTSGLEARDLQSSESAFVQVTKSKNGWQTPKVFSSILLESVLASQGKYGAYGTPTDVKIKSRPGEEGGFVVQFVSYTPAMRESVRQLWIIPKEVDNTLVMLIVGTTQARFSSQEKAFQKIVDSYVAIAAPESNLRR